MDNRLDASRVIELLQNLDVQFITNDAPSDYEEIQETVIAPTNLVNEAVALCLWSNIDQKSAYGYFPCQALVKVISQGEFNHHNTIWFVNLILYVKVSERIEAV